MNDWQWCPPRTAERVGQYREINEQTIGVVMRSMGFAARVKWHELTDCERALVRRVIRLFRDYRNWKRVG